MTNERSFARIGALLGDESRARILAALMDGRALTATELSVAGNVAPSTASSHLHNLCTAGLIRVRRRGRYRYFQISDPEIADIIESLMGLAARNANSLKVGPQNSELRYARVCYDHLAGEIGVKLYNSLRDQGLITMQDDYPSLTPTGIGWCSSMEIDLERLKSGRRAVCRACLDWSERRMHLAGGLGAAIFNYLISHNYIRRATAGRTIFVSEKGKKFIEYPVQFMRGGERF